MSIDISMIISPLAHVLVWGKPEWPVETTLDAWGLYQLSPQPSVLQNASVDASPIHAKQRGGENK